MRAMLVLLSCVPLITACSFLLDFDSLQGGKKSAADASADAASEFDSGNSGAGGVTAGDSGTASDSGAASDGASDACAGASCDYRAPRTDDRCPASTPRTAAAPLQLGARVLI